MKEIFESYAPLFGRKTAGSLGSATLLAKLPQLATQFCATEFFQENREAVTRIVLSALNKSPLVDEFNLITDPATKTQFYRENKVELDAAARRLMKLEA